MDKGIQSFFLQAGNNGFYFFCNIKIAERILKNDIDPLAALRSGIDNGFIDVAERDYANINNFYVRDPAKF